MGKTQSEGERWRKKGNPSLWNPLLRVLNFRIKRCRDGEFRNYWVCVGAILVATYCCGTGVAGPIPSHKLQEDAQPLRAAYATTVKGLDLSRAPSGEELMAAGQLGAPLFPTHDASETEREASARLAFGSAIEEWNKHEYSKAVRMLRQFVADHAESPWAGEARLHIGCDAAYNGRTSEAQEIFSQLILEHQGKEHFGARMLVNKARQRLAMVEAEQNNLDAAVLELRSLIQDSPDWRHRTYGSHWMVRLSQFAAARQALANCGAEALAYALRRQGQEAAAARVQTNLPASARGHSLAALTRMSSDAGMEMSGVELDPNGLGAISLPAILQVRSYNPEGSGHYWVLDKAQAGRVELYDPQSQRRFHQTLEELAKEWTGRALVFGKRPVLGGRRLRPEEMETNSGGCCGLPRKEDGLGNPDENPPPDQCSGGAPRWSVNVVSMNLFMTDTPLWYQPAFGPPVRITLSYNSQSAIAQYEPFGNKWQFNYGSYLVVDTAGTVTVFMPDGRRDSYAPDGSGGYTKPLRVFNTLTQLGPNHYELRFPDDTVYAYQIPGGTASQQPFLTEIRDAHGQKLSLGYDSNVHLTSITDAQGQVTTLSYNPAGLVTNVADPFGRNASFEYDASLNLTRSTDMGGYWTGYSYDTNVYLTSVSNQRGSWSFRIEPADGLENGPNPYPPPGGTMFQNYRITITDPLGHSSEYHYDGYSAYAWHVSSRDYIPWRSPFENNFRLNVPKTLYYFTTLGSGRQGVLNRIIYPAGDYAYLAYDPITGQLQSFTDAHGGTWGYTYNSLGRVTSAVDPNISMTTFNYAPNGVDLTSIVNGLGTIRLTWDSQHDVLSIQDRLTHTSRFTYNSYGQITSWADPLGVTNTYAYDSNNRLAQLSRAGQVIDSFTYDPIGRVRTHTDASGLTLTNDYNNLNQLTRVTYPDGKFETYSYSSCCPRMLDSATDRAGRITLFSYDPLKRLIQTTSPEGGITQFSYDPAGNLLSLKDPNSGETDFAYDPDGRLLSRSYPNGQRVSFGYDNAGLLVTRTNARGIVTVYGYDLSHNLISKGYSDGTPSVTNTYDLFNRLVQVVDGAGTNTYVFDANFQLSSYTAHWPGANISYAYDAAGRGTNLAAQSGESVAYAYDTENRLAQVRSSAGITAYGYSGASPLAQAITYPNGVTVSNSYDALNRILVRANRQSNQQLIGQYAYTYGPQDLRDSETVTPASPTPSFQNQAVGFQYNSLNQVLSSSAGQTFAYDNDGNLIQGYTPDGTVFRAGYDAENRLTSLYYTNASHVLCSNLYTYFGDSFLAIWKRYTNGALAGETRYLRALGLPVQERDGANQVVRQYVWGGFSRGGIGALLHLTQGGQHYSYVYDGKGNVAAVLDSSESASATYTYDAFGQPQQTGGTLSQPMQFSTKQYDPQTGLAYFGFRFYQPGLGRWLNRDPLGESAGLNAYAFVHNNPINRNDPSGLDDGFSSSPGGLGPQLNFNLGNFSGQLQAPWSYPGTGYNNFDLSFNLNLTPNLALVCDLSNQAFGIDIKNIGPFEVQLTGSSPNTGQLQISVDTGNPNIGVQGQATWGPQGSSVSFGVGGSF